MKLIFAVLLASLPALASDIRTVGGKKVDLQPIHDWALTSKGERPMPHWKSLTVTGYVKSLQFPVMVVTDGTKATNVLLKNCPGPLLEKLVRRQSLVRQLNVARGNLANAEANAEAKNKQSKAASKHARYAEFGSPASNDETVKLYASIDASDFASESRKNMEAIEKQIESVSAAIEGENKVFAMFTGQTYATFPIWDTGITAR